jgi:hypothetical protein
MDELFAELDKNANGAAESETSPLAVTSGFTMPLRLGPLLLDSDNCPTAIDEFSM